MNPRVLILGGTREAAALAERLTKSGDRRVEVVTSLAGRTARPRALPGSVRTGGFGGMEGLADYLRAERVAALIDATHPFAAEISANAEAAAAATGVPRLVLARPPWTPVADDRWIGVDDLKGAASALGESPAFARVFLAVGSGGLAAFGDLSARFFLVRAAQPVTSSLPGADSVLVVDRGPFTVDADRALLAQHRIDAVVSKNAGGAASYAKIAAARALGLPVVMVRRPPPPGGDTVASVDQALAWLERVLASVSVSRP